MTSAREPLLRAIDVRHVYGEPPHETPILHGVSLDLHPGALTVLMGPSGSGKTTLISILAGLLRPSAGHVELAGERITDLDDAAVTRARRRALGFVFQAFHLFPALSALDNVAEVLALGGLSIRDARDRARPLLERVGLAARMDNLPSQLSAGQRQRVAIARAIAPAPKVVIADEPTVALDGATAASVMELLRDYVGATTAVLLVTHDTRLVRASDRVIEIEDGRIARDGAGRESRPASGAHATGDT